MPNYIGMAALLSFVIAYFIDKNLTRKKVYGVLIKLILTVGICYCLLLLLLMSLNDIEYSGIVKGILLVFPMILLRPIWSSQKRRKWCLIAGGYFLFMLVCLQANTWYLKYEEGRVIKNNININVEEFMPFSEDSKIVKLDKEASLRFTEKLPILDGAAAVFPVYSAFVHAVYPSSVVYNQAPFYFNNTNLGYMELAEKNTDIFFGAYPSEEQIEYAKEQGTEFEYTEIGKEGFVFFVNQKNPVDSLTTQQVKGIYSGQITNWKEVGGKDEEIKAFQRNQGSGSQSMLIRFMEDVPIMDPPTTQVNDWMVGIIEQVADYKNYSNSIGFSFRYYLDSLVANPNVKMLKIDGVAPTQENISSGAYPIVTSLYAVTYKNNPNENVQKLLEWILSEEGQEIVYKTGYARKQ